MTYNLHNALDAQSARTRLDALIKKGCFIELTEKKPKRSLRQNNYLHLILSYFACRKGETLEYVKRYYYKFYCNKDIFLIKKTDNITGEETTRLRSSADLTTEEMTISIERFRNWAAAEAGEYIPEPNEQEMVMQMHIEVERNKQYL